MTDEELAKDLGLVSALTIGIGTMIGAGIFVLPGVAAQEAGPIVVVSFVVGGLIAMVNALAVSELGTAMPKAGGGYYYVNRGLGPLFGSISGLGDWMGLAFASAFYCIGFGSYLADLLEGSPLALPTLQFGTLQYPVLEVAGRTLLGGSAQLGLTDLQLGAMVAGLLFVGVNYVGAKETGGVQTVIVFVLLGILTVFAAAGLLSFDWGTVTADGLAPYGYRELLPGTALVFVGFLGYAKIATVAEELKNPGRNLPIAVIGSVAVVTVIYALLVGVMIGVVPYHSLDPEVPVSQVAEVTMTGTLGALGVTIVTIAAMLATASSANASILSSARINFAMGRERLVSDWLNEIHPDFATPYRSILLTGGLIVAFIVLLGQQISVLAKAASVLHLIVYGLMNLALIAFREADLPESEYDPDFRVPLYPVTPILGALLSFGLVGFMAPVEILLSLVFVAVAVAWYVLYARGQARQQGVLSRYVLERAGEMPDAAVSAASVASPEGSGPYRVMVPLANPETERELVELASVLAEERDGVVHAVHIVQVPDQTPLDRGADALSDLDADSEALLERAREHAAGYDVDVETTTVLSHRSFEEVFDAARELHADTVVMGWSEDRPWAAGRAERPLDELTHELPCDFLVLKDRGLDASRILLPTAGGPDSDLSAEVARVLRSAVGAEVHLLHVVDESERDEGEQFLANWAAEHGFGDAVLTVDDSGDVEGAIAREAADETLVILGATERGLLSRLVRGALVFDVVDEVDCSVLLAERPDTRPLRERLFGRR